MAIEGATIVSQHVIDDEPLKIGLQENETIIKTAAVRMARAMKPPTPLFQQLVGDSDADLRRLLYQGEQQIQSFSTKAAVNINRATGSFSEFGLASRALGSSLHLVTGETGFLAVELIRTTGHLSKIITVAGGATAAVTALGVATKGFLITIGPVGWALLAVGAAYIAYTKLTREDEEATKAATKAHEHQLSIFEAEKKAMMDLAVAKGTITATDRRRMELEGSGPLSAVESASVAATLRDEAALAEHNRILQFANEEFDIHMTLEEKRWARAEQIGHALEESAKKRAADVAAQEIRFLDEEYDIRTAKEEAFWANADRKGKAIDDAALKRQEALQNILIEFSSLKFSDFLTGEDKKLAMFGEALEEHRNALNTRNESRGFGITTQPLSGFRFGFGAMGGVIGEQSELKNITKAIKELPKEMIREAATNVGLKDPFRQAG